MAINFTDGSDYAIFAFAGKTYIGNFSTSVPMEVSADGGTHSSLGYDQECYFVSNPAEIETTLTIPASGSAELNWKITPVLFKDLVNTSADTNYNSIVFTYPKSQVAISNIGGDIIDATLLSAYKELCE
jgi:hypothetical protein